jgi:hypothetical protein
VSTGLSALAARGSVVAVGVVADVVAVGPDSVEPVAACVVVRFDDGTGVASSPPREERTIATTTPAIAAAATTAASTAFLTGPEATLARPWLHLWRSS